jgi:hypothetical protein
VSIQDPYRLGSLGDLIELIVDGWEITHLHYADACGSSDAPDDRAAAFVDLNRPDMGHHGLYIPDDDRTFSHRALLGVFRESPHIWKHRSAERIRERLAGLAAEERPEAESWGEIADPNDQPLDVSPGSLRGVVALGQIESIDDVTVALLSLERYRDFSRLRYLAHTLDPGRRGSLAALDVVAVDERGRRYRTASLGVERSGNRLEGVIALAPGIPRETTSLTVTIGTLGEGGPDGILGPWVFPIRLPAPTHA